MTPYFTFFKVISSVFLKNLGQDDSTQTTTRKQLEKPQIDVTSKNDPYFNISNGFAHLRPKKSTHLKY